MCSAAGRALLLAFLGLLAPARVSAQSGRPNVLFVLSDDQRADTIGPGGAHVRTPHLDRLASTGFVFERAHCMGSRQGAVCAPSRAMMLSGRGLYRIHRPFDLEDDVILLPELLRARGYTTFATGKWHNGRRAFARAFSAGDEIFFGGMGSHTELEVNDFDPDGEYPPAERHPIASFSSTAFVDAAIRFLREHDAGTPFFVHVALTAPHDPRTPPEAFRALYDPDEIDLPASFLPEHPFDNGELFVRDERLGARPRDPAEIRAQLADYYGMITHLDAEVGRLLAVLAETGHADDTIVVFASDHGLALGSHGLLGKQNLYEDSTRAPLILAGPGIPAGRSAALVYLLDLFPTLCDLTGTEAPEGIDGVSLVPILRGDAGVRTEIFTTYGRVQRALCTGRWKVIDYPAIGRTQLFDLAADPDELVDLAADPDHAGIRDELLERLAAARVAAGDELTVRGR